MINFILPNFYDYFHLNILLKKLLLSNPEYFNFSKMKINGHEGNFPFCYWSGKNYNQSSLWPVLADFQEVLNTTIDFLPIYLDYTNSELLESDYLDNKLNNLTSFFSNGSNKIIISDFNFGRYLQEKYPFYNLVGNENYYLKDTDKYFLDNLKFIKCNISDINDSYFQDIPKSKIIINFPIGCISCDKNQYNQCLLNCSKENLLFLKNFQSFNCSKTNFLDINDLINSLNKQGFNYFSFSSPANYDLIEFYLNLFIKPEYYYLIKLKMIQGEKYE